MTAFGGQCILKFCYAEELWSVIWMAHKVGGRLAYLSIAFWKYIYIFFLPVIFITFILYWQSLKWTLCSPTREDKAWGDMCHGTGYNVFLVSYRYSIAQALEKRNRNIYIWYKLCCGSTNRWQLREHCQQPRWHSGLFLSSASHIIAEDKMRYNNWHLLAQRVILSVSSLTTAKYVASFCT